MEPLRCISRVGGLAISKKYVRHGKIRIYHELKDGIPLIFHYWIQVHGALYPFDVRDVLPKIQEQIPEWRDITLSYVKLLFQKHENLQTIIRETFLENSLKQARGEEL